MLRRPAVRQLERLPSSRATAALVAVDGALLHRGRRAAHHARGGQGHLASVISITLLGSGRLMLGVRDGRKPDANESLACDLRVLGLARADFSHAVQMLAELALLRA